MSFDDSSELVLMVQNFHTLFCYFKISPMTVKSFEDKYGENSWRNSKPVLKVYKIIHGEAFDIKSIFIDAFADNWYINVDNEDCDLFVKLGRMLPDDTFAAFAISNTVTTSRSHESSDTSQYFVDISKTFKSTPYAFPASKSKHNDEIKEIKDYPFEEDKKK